MSDLRTFLLICMLLLCQLSLANDYDPLLLRAQATMYPKIIMLDQEIADKAINGVVTLTILYEIKDKHIAEKIKGFVTEKYGNKLSDMKLDVKLVNFSETIDYKLSTAYFLLRGTPDTHSALTRYASMNNRLVFCYDHNDFKHKTLISLMVKEKTYIYMNKIAIHDYNINFKPIFYKIIKVIE